MAEARDGFAKAERDVKSAETGLKEEAPLAISTVRPTWKASGRLEMSEISHWASRCIDML